MNILYVLNVFIKIKFRLNDRIVKIIIMEIEGFNNIFFI